METLCWLLELGLPNPIGCTLFRVISITLEIAAIEDVTQSILVSVVELPVSTDAIAGAFIKVKQVRTFVVHEVRKTVPVDILPVITVV